MFVHPCVLLYLLFFSYLILVDTFLAWIRKWTGTNFAKWFLLIRLIDMKLPTFLSRHNTWIGFWRKVSMSGTVAEITCLPFSGGGRGGNGLYGEAPAERGTFFMLQVYERVGLLLVLFLAEGFFSGCSGFPLSSKTNLSQFQFYPEGSDTFTRVLNNF